MTAILIMLNGPPRAGKDTASAAIAAALDLPVRSIKVTEPIKDEAHRRYGLTCAHDAFEALKDTPLPVFGGLTPREVYIATSRDLKRVHGEDVVCRMLVERVREAGEGVVVIPDLGDAMEANWLLSEVGDERTLLVRVHQEGRDFSHDCRTWVHLPDSVRQVDLDNKVGWQSRFEAAVGELARDFVETVQPPSHRWRAR